MRACRWRITKERDYYKRAQGHLAMLAGYDSEQLTAIMQNMRAKWQESSPLPPEPPND